MSATVAVHPLVGAEMVAPPSYWWGNASLARLVRGLLSPRSGWLTLPIPAFLVEHPERGPILIDTAFDPVVATDRAQSFGRAGAVMFAPRMRPEQAVGAQLRARGIAPEDVELVVMTHLHFDHASGMGQFPGAAFVVEGREWEAARRGGLRDGYVPRHLEAATRVTRVDLDAAPAADGFRHVLDLLGDGSIRLAFTPGHTHGHCSVLLATAGGPLLLCGDAAYARRTIERRWVPATLSGRRDDYVDSLAQIAGWIERHPDAPVVCGHDPWERAALERSY